MKINGWKYYNKAAIPTTAPHEKVDLSPIKNKTIWKMDGHPYFVRWTDNFDCGFETEWWYCIKDEPFDFSQIKSKRGSEIRKGLKLNIVKVVKALDYVNDIYNIQNECYSEYPRQYRPIHNYELTKESCEMWDKRHIVFMAFSGETGEPTGFACVEPINDYVNFEILKVPSKHKNSKAVAALTYNILIEMLNNKKYKYVCDGARNLVHQTNFMDYLVKHFNFRFAFCNLRMEYRPIIKPIIQVLFIFRRLFEKHSKSKLLYNINAILKMESISRKCKGGFKVDE